MHICTGYKERDLFNMKLRTNLFSHFMSIKYLSTKDYNNHVSNFTATNEALSIK